MKAAGDPRQIYIPRLEWAGNSTEVVFQQLNRLQNANQVVIGNAATGDGADRFHGQGRGLGGGEEFTWLAGGQSLLWLSERDGWRHAYSVPRDGGEARLLTPGDYDVVGVNAVDENGGWLYVTASPEAPTKRFVYRVPLDGKGKPERVGAASQTGVHRYDISPSATVGVPQLLVARHAAGHGAGAACRRAIPSGSWPATPRSRRRSRRWPGSRSSSSGCRSARASKWTVGASSRPTSTPAKKYPLLVYVYGEPAGQTVQDSWGGNTYLWHLMLAQQGYIVASFDNRGHAGAARARVAQEHLPADRHPRLRGSGGGHTGSACRVAICRRGSRRRVGLERRRLDDAQRHVPLPGPLQDRRCRSPRFPCSGSTTRSTRNATWACRRTTRRDTPTDRRSRSPRTCRATCSIVHGTGDDNVHYQGFEMLVNELVAADKRSSTMMSYPNRSHGISEGRGDDAASLHAVHELPEGDTCRLATTADGRWAGT